MTDGVAAMITAICIAAASPALLLFRDILSNGRFRLKRR
jgi:hypothetical protein